MSKIETRPSILARKYWLHLAPTWLLPIILMTFTVVEDFVGLEHTQILFLFVVAPLLFTATFIACRMRHKANISYGVFYLIWLGPMMVLWCSSVLIRGIFITALGRSL